VQKKGWILNLSRADASYEVTRDQEPVLDLDGEPVFEVWFFHASTRKWLVMALREDPAMAREGVIFFHPHEVPSALRARLQSLAVVR